MSSMPQRPLIHNDLAAEFRRQMPVTRRWAYLDHAAVAPLSLPAKGAMASWLDQATDEGDTVCSEWEQGVEEVRLAAATLIAANPAEVALVHNTTAGIGLVAEGFPWREGDNVVTLADEFPTNIYPWLNLASRGVQTRRVPTTDGRLDLNQLADTCDSRTRMVAISWVGYSTGFRHDLQAVGEIARRHGALVLVDAIQGLGVFPLQVSALPVDFLAADGHKWMLGPEGAGLLYIRRERLDELRPLGVGWHSVVRAYDYAHIDFRLKPTASRYEGGSYNCAGLLGLGGSLKLLLGLGIERIAERVLALTDLCCEWLTRFGARVVSHRDGEHRSGIVAFELPGREPASMRRHCLSHGVALSCRAGLLRISPHAYNNIDDIERLVDALVEG